MNTGDLARVTLESIATLSSRVEKISADMVALSDQLRTLSKRFNLSVAVLQDHQALVNRLAAIEEILAGGGTAAPAAARPRKRRVNRRAQPAAAVNGSRLDKT
jgi:uncharacterized protein YydD (DUF2326 family)